MREKFRPWALAVLAVAVLMINGGCTRADEGDQPGGGDSLLQRKLVWVHNIPVYNLDARSPTIHRYGSHYPLALRERPQADSYDEMIQEAQAAGVNGFSIDIFNDLSLIRPFYGPADSRHFLLAPCIDLGQLKQQHKDLEAGLLRAVTGYCREAAQHPSCARVNGAFVVFMYNNAALPVATWDDIRATLKNEGVNVFWVGDISVNFNWVAPNTDPSQDNVRQQTLKYFSTYDMGYSFTAIPDKYWDTIRSVFLENHKYFAGGMWPGYYRGVQSVTPIRPFGKDAQGTALYRGYWERQIHAGLHWTHVSTWNDYTEHTNLSADTSYNVTRGDLTAWYAARFRNQPPPFRSARLYVTTPQALYLNQPGTAEALVLNPTDHPVRVTLRLFDGAGTAYGAPASGVAEPGSEAAVSIPLTVADAPAGHFLRARAQMGAEGETPSAPILIYDSVVPPGNRIPLLYYSVPAGHALPGKVSLSVANGVARLSVPAGVTPRLVDLLHDQNIVKTVHSAQVGAPVTLDEDPETKTTDDNYLDPEDFGLYVERVIDSQDRVGFSDPVYVSAGQRGAVRRYAH